MLEFNVAPSERETTSLCRVCLRRIRARMVEEGGGVWMRKECPEHGPEAVRIAADATWYRETLGSAPALVAPKHTVCEEKTGCPLDCGPCSRHEQTTRLPVVPITSACNLNCPVCYTVNKNDAPYEMSHAELRGIFESLKAELGEIDIINFTGGEPTCHPRFVELMAECRRADIHRVTVSTNGLALANDETLVRSLAALDVRVVLSFDSFGDEAAEALKGASLARTKRRALELLEAHDVDTTLLPVVAKGVNDGELGRMIDLVLAKPFLRSLEIHTVTFTGQGGASFSRDARMTVDEVVDAIARETGGRIGRGDFVPSPCAHPLCYQVALLLLDPAGGPPVPFTRFLPRETLLSLLSDRLYLEPSAKLEETLLRAIDRLWADGGDEADRALVILKRVLREVFPKNRSVTRREAQRLSERAAKAIYIHSHMDEETFDTERVARCCVTVPGAEGTRIPTCSYNVLYRKADPRFAAKPIALARGEA